MKVIIIEDDAIKANAILSFLNTLRDDMDVRVLCSYQSGLAALETEVPDLVILDMALPTYDRVPTRRAGKLRPLGGYDLMRKLALRNVAVKTIVVTMLGTFGEGADAVTLEDMEVRCSREFPCHYLGSVYFQLEASEWRLKLIQILKPMEG